MSRFKCLPMRRLVSPAILAFGLALIASLAVHLPIYSALGVLADVFDLMKPRAAPSQAPVFVEFGTTDDGEDGPDRGAESEPTPGPAQAEVDPTAADDPEQPPPTAPAPDRSPQIAAPTPADVPQRRVQVTPPPAAERANRQAITQRSEDPTVEPPPDARFVAEQNRRVAEESVATLRNYQRDDQVPSAGPSTATAEEEREGNDVEEEVADLRDREGSEARTATPQEAVAERPEHASAEAPPNATASGDTARAGAARTGTGRDDSAVHAGAPAGARAEAGGEPRLLEVQDGSGSFVVAMPPEGEGGGDRGGVARVGPGSGEGGSGIGVRGSGGRRGERGRGRGQGSLGPDLRVSWSQFEQVYGRQQLDRDRETWVRERRSRMFGSNRQQEWREFRAAIENFVPNVRPGNQTALNAAASPFAEYLATVHRRIHREFADRFLRGLPAGATSPFSERSLQTDLEIIINRDGSVHRVGVVRPSGFLPFDYGAYAAVMRGQPYPEPPSPILSGDGRVYLHWGFYRSERQCGTFNAEPYILPNPPGTPTPRRGPLRDEPEWGGVVPDDARPTWGTDDGAHGGTPEGDDESSPTPVAPPSSPGDDAPEREPPPQRPAPPAVGAAIGKGDGRS